MSIDDALRFLDRAAEVCKDGAALRDGLLYAGKAAGVKMEEIAGEYPEPSGKPLEEFYTRTSEATRPYKLKNGLVVGRPGEQFKSKFKSMKQQRKVMAMLKKGKFGKRTGRLGASMTSETTLTVNGVLISTGTNVPYAPYVIGDDTQQSHYHAGTWEQLQRKIDAHANEVIAIFSSTLMNYLRGYLKGR